RRSRRAGESTPAATTVCGTRCGGGGGCCGRSTSTRRMAPLGLYSPAVPGHRAGMTDPRPHTAGETLDQLLERVIFVDPATHRLRGEWEETKRTQREVYERVCREEYERRLEYHRICRTPDPEAVARHEANLCK